MGKTDELIKDLESDVSLLIEAGFVAIKQIDEDGARKCFCAAIVLDPNLTLPVVGIGMINLLKLELDDAKEMFNMVLRKEPDNEMARTMLGIANLYTITDEGLKEGKQLIEEAEDNTEDDDIKQLGQYSHELYKEIKKKMKDLHPIEASHKLPPNKRLKN